MLLQFLKRRIPQSLFGKIVLAAILSPIAATILLAMFIRIATITGYITHSTDDLTLIVEKNLAKGARND